MTTTLALRGQASDPQVVGSIPIGPTIYCLTRQKNPARRAGPATLQRSAVGTAVSWGSPPYHGGPREKAMVVSSLVSWGRRYYHRRPQWLPALLALGKTSALAVWPRPSGWESAVQNPAGDSAVQVGAWRRGRQARPRGGLAGATESGAARYGAAGIRRKGLPQPRERRHRSYNPHGTIHAGRSV